MTLISKQTVNIHKELSLLWNEAQGKNKIRASLFTLIIYVQKQEHVDDYNQMIRSAISKFPCRVMLIISEEQSQNDYVTTHVESLSVGNAHDYGIYCEFIQINVGGNGKLQVPFLILPHLLPDLPVYLLWASDPILNDPVLSGLDKIAKRFIFDSGTAVHIGNFAKSILQLIGQFQCEVGDLGWSALTGWRKMLAHTFNSKEELDELRSSQLITITYNQQKKKTSSINQAAFLQAWLACQLNWKYQRFEMRSGNCRIFYLNNFGIVTFLLTPAENMHCKKGEILSIEIESTMNQAHYVMKRVPTGRQVFVQYANKNRCDIPYCTSLSGMQPGEEIIEEIFYPKMGEHYKAMLQYLAQIPWRTP